MTDQQPVPGGSGAESLGEHTSRERSEEWWLRRADEEPMVAMGVGQPGGSGAGSTVDLDAIRNKLRQLDVLSGLHGVAPQADLAATCEDIAFNDVTGLLAALEAAQGEIAVWKNERSSTAMLERARRAEADLAQVRARITSLEAVAKAVVEAPFTDEDGMDRLKRLVSLASAALDAQQAAGGA